MNFFFIGTEAELIKVFPIIIECKERGLDYRIIASGQNDIVNSRIFKKINCGSVDLELSLESSIKKSAKGLLTWFMQTYSGATKKIRDAFPDVDFASSKIIVHGDTVSTLMGAWLGKKLGMTVCHVEAGLRSHNWFNPFPEEIDRMLTSRCARVHFTPGDEPTNNLKNVKGTVINTQQNTLLDSLQYSFNIPVESDVARFLDEDYFVFVLHRQENLTQKSFVCDVVDRVYALADKKKCVIILHEITKNAFIKFDLMEKLEKHPNIILQPRVDYFDFMKVLNNAKFVITDGGSNQEELYYMGKPCLIMRKTTERKEGLGINAELYDGDVTKISEMITKYEKMCTAPVTADVSPSEKIVSYLQEN